MGYSEFRECDIYNRDWKYLFPCLREHIQACQERNGKMKYKIRKYFRKLFYLVMFFTTLTSTCLAQSVTGTVYSDNSNTYGFQVQLTYTTTVNQNYISAIDVPTPQFLVWRNSSSTACSGFDNIKFTSNTFEKTVTFDGYDVIQTSSTTPLNVSSGSVAFIHNHFPYRNGFVLNYNGKNADRLAYKAYKDGSWYTLKQVYSSTSTTPETLSIDVSQSEADEWYGQYTSYMAVVYIESGYIKALSGQEISFTFANLDYSAYFEQLSEQNEEIIDSLNFSDSNINSIENTNDQISDAEVSADMSSAEEISEAETQMVSTFDSYIEQYDEDSAGLIDTAFDTSAIQIPLLNISSMFDTWFSDLGSLQIVIYLSFLLELLFVVFFGILKSSERGNNK